MPRANRIPSPRRLETMFGDGTALIAKDPWLTPHREELAERQARFLRKLDQLEADGGILGPPTQAHRYFGFNRGERDGASGIWYREWAPGARALFLIGDFNGWDRSSHPMLRDARGQWSLFLPDTGAGPAIPHGSRLKVHVIHPDGTGHDRIPALIRRAVQDEGGDFSGQYWAPPEAFRFSHPTPAPVKALRIYEAHVGMAQEEGKVGSFREFRERVLPRVAHLGYNAIQLMGVMEHPYYGSFGYHVSSFYAVSSRFGTPEELKELIDAAHGLGIRVFLDIVHSHSVRNTLEGLNRFDGTDHQYFHAGARGLHSAWDSMVFDYGKDQVLHFLLSNVRFWLEEYAFDGFRFDGVTSMLYLDHGLGRVFSGYQDYFGANVDEDAVTYLKLANLVAHSAKPGAITIAEDVSGMPGTAKPLEEGGLGFDYRLAMGVPDYWIKLLKEREDERWPLAELWHTLLNRRRDERHVGYAESHDQALVGDKTLAFRLMDEAMYTSMSRFTPNAAVDRGIALHKLIRLLTFSLAGEGWLSFMGNEFGHPEWIDFPREGNGWSFAHARRQWSLADRDDLRYRGLAEFDRALQSLDETHGLLAAAEIERLSIDEAAKLLVFRRGPLVLAFNLHPNRSLEGLRIPVPEAHDYRVALDTDDRRFEGFGLVEEGMSYPWQEVGMDGRAQSVRIYLPARSAQVLAPR